MKTQQEYEDIRYHLNRAEELLMEMRDYLRYAKRPTKGDVDGLHEKTCLILKKVGQAQDANLEQMERQAGKRSD